MTGLTHLDLPDAAATEAAGRLLAPLLRVGDVVTLDGDLGAGKTAFARGVIAGLGHAGDVPSPTFAIVQPYAPPDLRLPVAHVDLYRIEDADEAAELGLDDYRVDGVLLVEWPGRLPAAAWADALALRLGPLAGGRRLTWAVPAAWGTRWPLRLPR